MVRGSAQRARDWGDEWWIEAVEAIADVARQDALRRFSADI